MFNRLNCGIVAALLASAVLVPSVHAASLDIGQLLVGVTDTAGALSATKTGGIFNLHNGPLDGDMITAGNFDLEATFNAADVLQSGGTVKILGSLRSSLNPAVIIEAVDFEGSLTSFSQSGNALNFGFNVTTADPLLASNFGPLGIIQLTLSGAPVGFDVGRGFTVTGANSTVDVTAVPTPTAAVGGMALLGGLAMARFLRTRKLA